MGGAVALGRPKSSLKSKNGSPILAIMNFLSLTTVLLIYLSADGLAQIPDFNAALETEEQTIADEAPRVESIDTLFITVRNAPTA
jgi:hypothetical protein